MAISRFFAVFRGGFCTHCDMSTSSGHSVPGRIRKDPCRNGFPEGGSMSLVQTLLTTVLSGPVVDRIAGLIGVDPAKARQAITAAAPALLAGLVSAATNPQGSKALVSALTGLGKQEGDPLADDLTATGAGVTGVGGILSSLFGEGTLKTLSSKVGDYAGLSQEKSAPLMGAVGSLLLGSLGKAVAAPGATPAGILDQLIAGKDEIAKALPSGLAQSLGAAGGLLGGLGGAAASAATTASTAAASGVESVTAKAAAAKTAVETPPAATAKPAATPKKETPPAQKSPSKLPLILGVVVLALLAAWALGAFRSPPPAPPAPPPAAAPAPTSTPPATSTTPEPATPAPTPAPTTTPAPSGGPTDVITGAIDRLRSTLDTVTDRASAEAALPALQGVSDSLGSVASMVSALPDTARTAINGVINSALPALQSTQERLFGNSEIAEVIRPVLTDVMSRLRGLVE
ncbi:hypothetical protein CDV50_11010 [Haematobacter massiliensis]|nr:hypothetical protein CDV50_11010 [Haematobacter massiliensis]OWJ88400.1 hypothetical protein CDV51_01800 [Haematobacter massiliensis]